MFELANVMAFDCTTKGEFDRSTYDLTGLNYYAKFKSANQIHDIITYYKSPL